MAAELQAAQARVQAGEAAAASDRTAAAAASADLQRRLDSEQVPPCQLSLASHLGAADTGQHTCQGPGPDMQQMLHASAGGQLPYTACMLLSAPCHHGIPELKHVLTPCAHDAHTLIQASLVELAASSDRQAKSAADQSARITQIQEALSAQEQTLAGTRKDLALSRQEAADLKTQARLL